MERWHRIAFPTPKPLDIIQQQMERTNRSGANSIVHKLGIQLDDDEDLAIFLMCVCVFSIFTVDLYYDTIGFWECNFQRLL